MAIADLKAKWAAMRPATKQKFVISAVVGGIALGGSLLNMMSDNKPKKPVEIETGATKAVAVDQKILEKSMATQSTKQTEDIAQLKEKLAQLEKGQPSSVGVGAGTGVQPNGRPSDPGSMLLSGLNKPAAARQELPPPAKEQSAPKSKATARQMAPPPPIPSSADSQAVLHQSKVFNVAAQAPVYEMVGDIEIVTNTTAKDKPAAADKKKGKRTVYLPPSFMAATLISGLNATTSEAGRGNPGPVFIRIKDLAFLPNEVKSDLRGCFAVAEGFGDLAQDRVTIRLVSMSCLSKKGESVIDAKIKGFVTDKDSKLGVSGKPVWKMGATMARAVAAGFFGGAGDAFKQAGATSNVSALGTTTTPSVDPANIALAAAGNGLASGSKEIQKVYLDLVKSSMPVIEMTAGKDVTLFVQEGVNLEIKSVKSVPRI